MKKLFVSVPMRGADEEEIMRRIDRLVDIAKAAFNLDEVEIIHNLDCNPDLMSVDCNNPRLLCLGEAVKKMAYADYFIGILYSECYKGCNIEAAVAKEYHIPCLKVPEKFILA